MTISVSIVGTVTVSFALVFGVFVLLVDCRLTRHSRVSLVIQ
ncbi:hypothetical protein [Haloplanus halobius]|nr:hypothetical protein [Haloplanus sp. XH21]